MHGRKQHAEEACGKGKGYLVQMRAARKADDERERAADEADSEPCEEPADEGQDEKHGEQRDAFLGEVDAQVRYGARVLHGELEQHRAEDKGNHVERKTVPEDPEHLAGPEPVECKEQRYGDPERIVQLHVEHDYQRQDEGNRQEAKQRGRLEVFSLCIFRLPHFRTYIPHAEQKPGYEDQDRICRVRKNQVPELDPCYC